MDMLPHSIPSNWMPPKDPTSDGDSNFALIRKDYRKSNMVSNALAKKWYGGNSIRDASHTMDRNKTAAVGKFSSADTVSFQTKNNINVRREALIRTRNQGYVIPAKVRAKPANNLTPGFAMGTLVRTQNRAPVNLLNFPLWKSKGDVICNVSLAGNCYNIYVNPSPTIFH